MRALLPALLLALLALPLAAQPRADTRPLEKEAAAFARQGAWTDVLHLLAQLHERDAARYADGRFDYLAARALAGLGRDAEALPRFERFVATGDLFDVPARLSAARLRFAKGDGLGGLDLLLPLLQRRGAVGLRALRITLDALETSFDPVALGRLAAVHPQTPTRERRRLQALRAEQLDREGATAQAAALRRSLLAEARRDDAAAALLARELRGLDLHTADDALLRLLIDTARAQRDLDLAERLAEERERRALAGKDPVERAAARFDLARIRSGRGRFAEGAAAFRTILAEMPAPVRAPRNRKDDGAGTPAFLARVRFNLGAMHERLGELDAAIRELAKVEAGRVGPAPLAALQAARLEIRRGDLARGEALLSRPIVLAEPGRTEGLLLLLQRAAESGDAKRAARALAAVEARGKKLPEPWRTELPFWRGLVAEAAQRPADALAHYLAAAAAGPGRPAGDLALERARALPRELVASFVAERRGQGEKLLAEGHPRDAKDRLLPAAILGDAEALGLLKLAYGQLPGYAEVVLSPDLPADALPDLCGDAAACRLLRLGLPEDAEPIVRDARRLDTLHGCVVAARLAEGADAGPAALEAAEALSRKIPADFLLDLAPRTLLGALAPRPFDAAVAGAAAEIGVPRELLYAVMRQESRFDREAASPAAARGLMQLTLPAAGEAARELNESPPAYVDLYDPVRSIRLGGRTLRSLLDRFGGDAFAAAAAYNAGGGQTSLWIGGSKHPPEALLGSVSYVETRGYVRHVLTNRRLYLLALGPGAATGDRR